jgi:hypothetical protein
MQGNNVQCSMFNEIPLSTEKNGWDNGDNEDIKKMEGKNFQ